MFTTAFPLAPFIALVVSLIEIRLDAHRLLWFNRRPLAFIAADIGKRMHFENHLIMKLFIIKANGSQFYYLLIFAGSLPIAFWWLLRRDLLRIWICLNDYS